MTNWTDEQVELLKTLWPDLSASQITQHIPNSTRSGIIGKANRLGLPSKTHDPVNPEVRRARKAENQRRYYAKQKSFAEPKPAKSRESSKCKAVEEAPPTTADPVLLMEREPRQCAWILDEAVPISSRQCCGARTLDITSWCPYHYGRTHQPDYRQKRAVWK